MLSALLVALATVPLAQASPVIVGVYQDPGICYAGESLELWVEVTGDDVDFSWDASDDFYDWGGSLDIFDEDGLYLTCPACPPAQDGDVFTISLEVSDASGDVDATDWEIEVTCGSSSGKVETGCMTSQAVGGLLLTLGMVGLRQRRA